MADYPYGPGFAPMMPPEGGYADRGDGFGDYYAMAPRNPEPERAKHNSRKTQRSRRHDGHTRTLSRGRSRSQTQSRSRSRSQSRSRSDSKSRSRSRTLTMREPSFLDAFRVLYLIPSQQKKKSPKYLATQKRQDRIQELLKSDGLGSKRWLFYPRLNRDGDDKSQLSPTPVAGSRDNCDQRIKIDADFFRKYKKSKRVDSDAPIAKLKRWELIMYKRLGFIQAV